MATTAIPEEPQVKVEEARHKAMDPEKMNVAFSHFCFLLDLKCDGLHCAFSKMRAALIYQLRWHVDVFPLCSPFL